MVDHIGIFLKRLRGKMSLREAAERSGFSHSYIAALEQNKRPSTNTPIKPSPDALKALSKAYNYSYEDLMKKAGYMGDEEKLSIDESEQILKEIVHKYNLDLTNPDIRENVEKIIQIVYADHMKKK